MDTKLITSAEQLQVFCYWFLTSIADRRKKLVKLKIYALAIIQKSIM